MTREEAFKRLEQMYDFYAHAMDANKNYPLKGDAEAIKVVLLVMAKDRSAHITREQVEKVWRGCRSCKGCRSCVYSIQDLKDMPCKKCDPNAEGIVTEYKPSNFCPACGKPLTDEAVQMVMERLEALKDGSTTD